MKITKTDRERYIGTTKELKRKYSKDKQTYREILPTFKERNENKV
jgi:hypothetical protein